ncbi:MAG: monovalent cation/H+ antiporter subunit D family protein [Clostridiales bacterium]|nr:monovalent cation/H+ antiporter subunit D family protein [Clostridiales bacterium]
MSQLIQLFPLLSILILLIFGAFLTPLLKRKKIILKLHIAINSLVTALSFITLFYVAKFGPFVFQIGHYPAPFGIVFKIGPIESSIGLMFSFVMTMVMWYSIFSLEKEIKEKRVSFFYILNSLLLASLLGIVYTSDIFNGYVFLEVSTLAACGIIIVKDKKENIKAAIKYLLLSSLGSGLVLMGIAFIYSISGHLNMTYIHGEIIAAASDKTNLLLISLILFTIGLGIKSAMFPMHVWLPDAHTNAPSPSSAILSSLVIKAPVVFLIKIYYLVYGIEFISNSNVFELLLIFGGFGMIMGSLFARRQKILKRLIAYSSVAQMGYIFLGIGLGNELGLTIAIYHMIAHGLTKSSLFLSAGSFIEQTGFKNIEDFKGIGKEMPVTLGIFTLSALSLIGIPVLPGFISKWNLALASIESGKIYLLAIILISSLLNAVYYFPIIINGYFGEDNLDGKVFRSKSKPIKELIPVIILSLVMVAVGFLSGSVINFIKSGISIM